MSSSKTTTPHNLLRVLRNEHTMKYYTDYKVTPNSGVDAFVSEEVAVTKTSGSQTFTIHSDMFCEFLVDGEPSAFWFVPRSSLGTRTPLNMANSVGAIDSSYRGELLGAVRSDGDYLVEVGQRLFQIIAPDMKPIHVELVDFLSETERGAGGFGSTGK